MKSNLSTENEKLKKKLDALTAEHKAALDTAKELHTENKILNGVVQMYTEITGIKASSVRAAVLSRISDMEE